MTQAKKNLEDQVVAENTLQEVISTKELCNGNLWFCLEGGAFDVMAAVVGEIGEKSKEYRPDSDHWLSRLCVNKCRTLLKRFNFCIGFGRVNYPSCSEGWFMAEYISHALVEVPGGRVGPYSNGYQKTFDTDRVWEISMGRIVKFHRADPAPHRITQKPALEGAKNKRSLRRRSGGNKSKRTIDVSESEDDADNGDDRERKCLATKIAALQGELKRQRTEKQTNKEEADRQLEDLREQLRDRPFDTDKSELTVELTSALKAQVEQRAQIAKLKMQLQEKEKNDKESQLPPAYVEGGTQSRGPGGRDAARGGDEVIELRRQLAVQKKKDDPREERPRDGGCDTQYGGWQLGGAGHLSVALDRMESTYQRRVTQLEATVVKREAMLQLGYFFR